jgi:hypothetical protein
MLRASTRQHSVGLASARGSLLSLLEKYGVKHFEIDQDWARPFASARGFLKLRHVIGQFKPNIVHPTQYQALCLIQANSVVG